MRQLREKEEKSKKLRERNEMADKARREKMERDAKARQQEEQESLNKLEGRLVILLDSLQADTTPVEISLSGLDLGPQRSNILAKNIAYNKSLLAIHLARKGILDVDG